MHQMQNVASDAWLIAPHVHEPTFYVSWFFISSFIFYRA